MLFSSQVEQVADFSCGIGHLNKNFNWNTNTSSVFVNSHDLWDLVKLVDASFRQSISETRKWLIIFLMLFKIIYAITPLLDISSLIFHQLPFILITCAMQFLNIICMIYDLRKWKNNETG